MKGVESTNKPPRPTYFLRVRNACRYIILCMGLVLYILGLVFWDEMSTVFAQSTVYPIAAFALF